MKKKIESPDVSVIVCSFNHEMDRKMFEEFNKSRFCKIHNMKLLLLMIVQKIIHKVLKILSLKILDFIKIKKSVLSSLNKAINYH